MDIDLSSFAFEKTFGAHYVRGKIGNKVTYEEDTYRSASAEDDEDGVEVEEEEWKTCFRDVLVSLGEPMLHDPFCDSLCSSSLLRHRITLYQACTPGHLGPYSSMYRGGVVKEVDC
jgi:hypothetical protein